mmetsp:Transcript_19404/g.32578  ORF Transcript_19404/g.32578 Transcript_19404/m.32578 type:complete len:124 (-) Transcript_19404:10-381(-)
MYCAVSHWWLFSHAEIAGLKVGAFSATPLKQLNTCSAHSQQASLSQQEIVVLQQTVSGVKNCAELPVRAAKAFGHGKALNKEPSDTVSSSVLQREHPAKRSAARGQASAAATAQFQVAVVVCP